MLRCHTWESVRWKMILFISPLGTYPTEYAEMTHMRVCKMSNDSDCEHKWDTYVMHCDGFNVAHLTPYFQGCGKYCTGRSSSELMYKNVCMLSIKTGSHHLVSVYLCITTLWSWDKEIENTHQFLAVSTFLSLM